MAIIKKGVFRPVVVLNFSPTLSILKKVVFLRCGRLLANHNRVGFSFHQMPI
jgi:hypothetical protein